MRSPRNLPVYLVYIVACVAAIGFVVSQMGVTWPWSHPYRVTAQFTDASSILRGNEVMMDGVKVGRVESVSAGHGLATVDMVLDNPEGAPLHRDATAQVRKKNLLGETYIDLHRGSGAVMDTDARIPVSQTIPITEIDQVLAVFDPDTRERMKLLINGLGAATNGRGDDLNAQAPTAAALATSLQGPAAELDARRQQVSTVVTELQLLYDRLAQQRNQVRDGFATWNDVMAQLAAQDSALAGTVQQADTLLTNLDTLTRGENGNLRATLEALPVTLATTRTWLSESTTILARIAPYRQQVHDIFPNLQTSFADTDPSGQHFWSVYSVNCASGCSSSSTTGNGVPAGGGGGAATASWSTLTGGSP